MTQIKIMRSGSRICFLIICTILTLAACEFSYKEIIYFDDAIYTITDIEATDTTLVIKGQVENHCNYSFKAPW